MNFSLERLIFSIFPAIFSRSPSNNSFFIHSATIFFSGRVFTKYGTLLFNPTIIKHTTILYYFPFSSAPKVSPPQYSSHFYKNISSNITTTSSEMFPFSLKIFADFIASIFPTIFPFLKQRKRGKFKLFYQNLVRWKRRISQHKSILYRICRINCCNSFSTSPHRSLSCRM